MKSFRSSALALACACATFAGSASAVSIDATFNFVPFGTLTADTGDVTTASTITTGAPDIVTAILSNNIGLVSGQQVFLSPNPLGVKVGSTFSKTFTTPLGTFLETLTVTGTAPTMFALGATASGTIVQTAGTGFDPTPIFYSAAYTQNQGPGSQINASFNDSTTRPGSPVPEPATLAMLGLGLLGVGLSRRRKS